MGISSQNLMSYIDAETRSVCGIKRWGHQVRRKWSVRNKPVSKSGIDDYEWKLIPITQTRDLASSSDYEGVYYVVFFNIAHKAFVLQHDTHHCGLGKQLEITTFSEIGEAWLNANDQIPPTNWLRDHLLWLIERCEPNTFSYT